MSDVLADAAALQALDTEAYRRTPYPALIHPHTHPDRMAVVARLAGMDPPDIRTARVLEVGVGNGLNLLSMAQALPEARFTGFDIDPLAIAQGVAWVAETGAHNVTLTVMDLLDAAEALTGEYDYIIAHGVFAWVPEVVADALLALVGRRLAPNGVAFVSGNTLPGCHIRLALRDAMLRAAGDATDDAERLERARAALARIATPDDEDLPIHAGLRAEAQSLIGRPEGSVMLHDELGASYHPRYLHEAVARANAHGLDFLGDCTPDLIGDALLSADAAVGADHQTAIEQNAYDADEVSFRFFRRMLFVRRGAAPDRVLRADRVAGLFAATSATASANGIWQRGNARARLSSPTLIAMLERLSAMWPARLRVSELGFDLDHARSLIGLSALGLVSLHSIPAPFATTPGAHPVVSPLARWTAAQGLPWVATLDHRALTLDPVALAALLVLDGAPDEGRFAATLAEATVTPDQALRALAAEALLVA